MPSKPDAADICPTPDELHLVYDDFSRCFEDLRFQFVEVPLPVRDRSARAAIRQWVDSRRVGIPNPRRSCRAIRRAGNESRRSDFGHLRTFERCAPTLKENLLDRYPDHEVFLHTWDRLESETVTHHERFCMPSPVDEETIAAILATTIRSG